MTAVSVRRWIGLVSLVVAIAVVLGSAGCARNKPPAKKLRIGADFTFTGVTAYWSQQLRKGIDLAVDEAASAKGQPEVEVVYEDNQGNPTNGVSAFSKLANVDQVSLVLSCFTPIAKPLRANAAQLKVPLLATVTSALDFGMENEWSFRDFPPQDQQGVALAQYAYRTLGLRRVAPLVVNDDYGRDGQKAFSDEFARLGGQVLPGETVEQKATDARSQLTKILGNKPDGLMMIVRDTTLGKCVAQARELGFKGQIIGVNAFDAPPVWKAAGNTGEGIVFTSAYVKWDDADAKRFTDAYRAKYSEAPDWVALYGYTIGQYCIDTLRQTGGDRDRVRAALAKLDRESIRGRLVMSPKREVLSPVGVYKRASGSNVLLEKIEPRTK